MSYASASDVAAYCPHLLDSGHENFTKTTRPTLAAVTRFLSAGCSLIETRLKGAGYTTPVSISDAVYDQIVDLEALYGAGRAEMVGMTSRVAMGEKTRSQIFMDQFNLGLDRLLKMDLSRAGLGGTAAMYAGGISVSDKDTQEASTDRTPLRFKKSMWKVSGTTRPGGVAANEETE